MKLNRIYGVTKDYSLIAHGLKDVCASRNNRLGLPELTSWQTGTRERPLVIHRTPDSSGSVTVNYSSTHICGSCVKRGGFLVQMTTRILMIVLPSRFTQRLSHWPCTGTCTITAAMPQSHPTCQLQLFDRLYT